MFALVNKLLCSLMSDRVENKKKVVTLWSKANLTGMTRFHNRFKSLCNVGISMLLTLTAMFMLESCSSTKKLSVKRMDSVEEERIEMRNHKPGHMSSWQKNIFNEAMTWIGTPYKYAGAEKGIGADCSGFVLRVFENTQGWKLPRNSAKQAEYCERISEKEVIAGDLVFFATGSDPQKISHVGIMLDDVAFVHASSTKGVVVSQINSPYYSKRIMMFGRLPEVMKIK